MIENESQPTLKYHFVPGFVGCRTQYIHQESSKCLLCAYGNLSIGYLVKAICTGTYCFDQITNRQVPICTQQALRALLMYILCSTAYKTWYKVVFQSRLTLILNHIRFLKIITNQGLLLIQKYERGIDLKKSSMYVSLIKHIA